MTINLQTNSSLRSFPSRLYETEDDLRQMQDLLMEARARTNDWRYFHVGELMWDFFMVTCHLDPQEYIRLWHDRQGNLVAYAILGEDPSFNFQVLPEHEWCGIEAEALAWAESLIMELRDGDPKQWGGHLVSGSRQDNAKRIAFLEQHGFRRGEYAEINFLRSMSEPIQESTIPAGYQVRAVAETGEVTTRANAERVVWGQWSVGKISDEDYSRLMRMPGYQRELDVVAVTPDGVIASYVNGWIDPLNRIGDLGPVGALPEYRRQGLTRAVLLECLRRFKDCGMERACVSTGVQNTAAIGLYESIGFKRSNKYLEYVKTG